jgi:hypothetical protein
VAPDRAELLAARGHPRLLAEPDLRAGVEDFASVVTTCLGSAARTVDLPAEVAEGAEGKDEDEAEPAPEPARGSLDASGGGWMGGEAGHGDSDKVIDARVMHLLLESAPGQP